MNTDELITEAKRLIADCRTYNFGLRNADRLAQEVAPQLVDALEAATRVPVHGEPNDEREVLEHIRTTRARQRFLPNNDREALEAEHDGLEALYAAGEISFAVALDRARAVGTALATVPDAREHLHAKCDCVPDLGPAHCHLCSEKAGSPVQWVKCEAVISVPDAAEEGGTPYSCSDLGHYDCDGSHESHKPKAERDAALAAIERVRQILSVPHRDNGVPPYWHHQLLAALDGAPEPEWEYAREYRDEAGYPTIRKARDITTPDGHRSDGSPYWNYQVLRRRKAGPWIPVEGESKP